jgi:molecular chaperone HtpG
MLRQKKNLFKHSICSILEAESMGAERKRYEFKAEMKQLLDIIINSLYTNREIFLRELVSNASDALNKIRFRKLTDSNIINPELDLNIKINVDKERGSFSIEDTGIGMSKDDLIERIGTVANSGTLDFVKNLRQAQGDLDGELIGKFGVGFYSAFMVTDEINIETLYADTDSKGYKWVSKGDETFEIEEVSRNKRGTKIYFNFKEEYKEYADPETIKSILKKYSNFVDFPIFVNDEEMKKVKPLWQRNKEDIKEGELNEFYKFISNDFEEPLGYAHFSIEGKINFKGLVFVPKTAPPTMFSDLMDRSLQLYSNRIFIQDDCKELLPDYLRFLRGVIDTEDLPLNISREVTQSNPLIAKMRNVITGKVLLLLEDWAKNDNEKYEIFYKNWGSLLKTGLNTDFTNKEKLTELVRYETSALEKGKTKSLKEYVQTMQPEQKEIYYIMGDNRELIERNPNLEYFRKNALEVIYLFDPVDVFTFPYINTYDGKSIKSIEKADIKPEKEDSSKEKGLGKEQSKSLLEFMKNVLKDKVEDVVESKRLVDSPVTLVVGSKGIDPQMEKMLQYMDKGYEYSKKIFEVNTSHSIIKNLYKLYNKNNNDELLKLSVEQLFEGALLIDGQLKDTSDFVFRMNEILSFAHEDRLKLKYAKTIKKENKK